MKALVYKGPRELVLDERPYPQLAAGEVIVKVEAVGICGSELHGYLGHDKTRAPGMIFGHEFAGRIVQSASPGFAVGTLVTANSAVHCGRCDFCLQGRDNLCDERKSIGKWRPGAFAEFISLPASALVDVPQDIDPVQAALVEPTATPMHGINLSMRALARPIAETTSLVIGGGAIGFIAALLLRSYGVDDLTVGEPNAGRRLCVERHARCATYDPKTAAVEEGAFDYVFDAVGSRASFASAMQAVKRGGVIAEVGLHDQECALDIQKLTRAGITVVGGANYPTIELRASVRAICSGLFTDLSWVDVRTLTEAPVAFEALIAGHPFPKVVLLPHVGAGAVNAR